MHHKPHSRSKTDDWNCWINRQGIAHYVRPGLHMPDRRDDDIIRISMPERRRTWVGIEYDHPFRPIPKPAADKLLQMVKVLHKMGYDIRADLGIPKPAAENMLQMVKVLHRQGYDIRADLGIGHVIECMASDRLTELNRAIRKAADDPRDVALAPWQR